MKIDPVAKLNEQQEAIDDLKAHGRSIAEESYEYLELCKMAIEAEQLRVDVDRLRAALKPFASIGIPGNWPENNILDFREDHSPNGLPFHYIGYTSTNAFGESFPTIADYRRAAEVLG